MKQEIISVIKQLLEQPEIRNCLLLIVQEANLNAIHISTEKENANKLISTQEACAILSISRQTLSKWIKANRVTKMKVKGSNSAYYSLAEIKSLLKDYSYGKKEEQQ